MERVVPGGVAWRSGRASFGALDQAEAVALVARARRDILLRAHRRRLPREDLEDCYSQATLELLARARRGEAPFVSHAHVANALEQRFVSRIQDRQRAIGGRSPMEAALFRALPLGDPEHGDIDAIDIRVDVEELILLRQDLRRIAEIADGLTHDQRLVLASQLAHLMRPEEFCRRYGWSLEKYRKVAQRARARLQRLLEEAPRDGRKRRPVRAAVAGAPGVRRAERRPLPRSPEMGCPTSWGQSDKKAGTHL